MKYHKRHYSIEHLNIIKKNIKNKRYDKALKELYIYFDNFPKDNYARLLYTDILLKLGKFDKADDVLSQIFINEEFYYILLLKLRCYQNDFLEANKILNDIIVLFENNGHISDVEKIYILKQTNYDLAEKIDNKSYLGNQILNYSEQKLFDHIKKHTFDSDIPSIAKFYDIFPLNELFQIIKNQLPTTNKLYDSIICYNTIFKYNCCGEILGNTTNYFKIVALNTTNEIISMYPCLELPDKIIGYTDLNYIKGSNQKSKKINRLTQIEKFNQRYNK